MNTEIEIWKPVYGFESQYQVSNLGRVKSLGNNFSRKEKILKNIDRLNGYSTVKMSINTPQKTYRIHRLVAIAFLGLDPNQNKLVVDHIDNNKTNDLIENLQILTPKENNQKSFLKGETLFEFKCPVCKKIFKLTARQSHKKEPCCSRKCGGIKSHWK